jgi:hypothetical protein
MELVEVGRFLDLSEAQTAASALRASGMEIFVQNENWGQTEAYLQLAMGGFRLWTRDRDAEAARAFIKACRAEPSEIAPQGGAGQAVGALALLLLLGPAVGWIATLFHRRGSRFTPELEDKA